MDDAPELDNRLRGRLGEHKLMNSRHLVCALVCLQACVTLAQDDDAPARARRDADNPLRMIIEASKIKPRQKALEAEPAPKAVSQRGVERPTAARQAAVTAAGLPAPHNAAERTSSLPLVPATEPAKPADPLQIGRTAAAGVGQEPAEEEAPVQSALPAPSPASVPMAMAEPLPSRESASEAPAAVLPMLPSSAAPVSNATLELVDYVEPVLPDRLRRRLRNDGEVVVQFTVGLDGSVVDASVRSSSDGALEPVALDAVRQWHYRPIATAQAHAVQLVFRLRE